MQKFLSLHFALEYSTLRKFKESLKVSKASHRLRELICKKDVLFTASTRLTI